MKNTSIFNKQLALPLQFVKLKNQENFLINDSNKIAISLIDQMHDIKNFKKKYIYPVLYIFGPERSGKTHLAHIFKEKNNGIFVNKIQDKHLSMVKNGKCLILDDFEEKVKLDEKLLFHFLNETYSTLGSVLLLSKFSQSKIKFQLPDLKSRIKSLISAEINLPSDEILYFLLVKELDEKKIFLTDKHCFYVIKRIKRNYKTVLRFVKEIDRFSLEIKKKITISHIRDILLYINKS